MSCEAEKHVREVLQRRSPYELPDVDAHYMSWHKDLYTYLVTRSVRGRGG